MGPNDGSRRFDRPRHWLLRAFATQVEVLRRLRRGGPASGHQALRQAQAESVPGCPGLSTSPVHEHAHQVGYRKYNGHKYESWR
jgi:hypothetical protein